MPAFTFRMTGTEDTVRRVQAFEKRLRRKWLSKAGRAGAKPVKAAMIRAAPQDKNALPANTWRKSVAVKMKLLGGGVIVWFGVGPRSAYIVAVALKVKFFRDKSGRIRPIPRERSKRPERFKQERRPVLYSHRAEAKHHTIERTVAETRSASQAATEDVLRQAVEDV